MVHTELTEDLHDQIIGYAMHTLDQVVAQEVALHLQQCALCQQELMAMQATLGVLPYSVPPVLPPPSLKARLFERIHSLAPPHPQPALARAVMDFTTIAWEPSDYPGVSFHWLRQDEATGTATALVKIQPGCRYGDHLHRGGEDCLVLQGGFRDRWGEYHAGDFVYYEPGSVHHDFQALEDETCMLFVVAHGGLELLPTAG